MEATINLKQGHGVQASVQVADFIKQYTENGTQEWSKEIQIITHLFPYRLFTAGQKVNSKHMLHGRKLAQCAFYTWYEKKV